MSDNHYRYRSIRIALSQMFSKELNGYGAKQLNVLASLISGIVGSKSTNYPKIAGKVPDRTKVESRVKRYSRYINEADPEQEIYQMPFAADLLAKLSAFTLVLIIDGSDVGRNCVTLMLNVRYRGRALPIGWLVISGKKGHFSEERHVQLVTTVQKLVPEGADVVFLGDGGFDGTELQAKLEEFGWKFVCRTAKNAILFTGYEFSFQELLVEPGDCLNVEDVLFTRQKYGPLLAVIWWRKEYEEPLYLISNLDLKEEACFWYRNRFKIETFFLTKKVAVSICTRVIFLTQADLES